MPNSAPRRTTSPFSESISVGLPRAMSCAVDEVALHMVSKNLRPVCDQICFRQSHAGSSRDSYCFLNEARHHFARVRLASCFAVSYLRDRSDAFPAQFTTNFDQSSPSILSEILHGTLALVKSSTTRRHLSEVVAASPKLEGSSPMTSSPRAECLICPGSGIATAI